MKQQLSLVLGEYAHVAPLVDGTETVPGYDLAPRNVKPIIGAYRQMVRDLAFDICELAPVTYLLAREAGIPLVAIPVFINRRFHIADIFCGPGSGIEAPGDLQGRAVGVRAFSVSTGVWGRGMLHDDHNVDISKITWVVDDDDHVARQLPPNVRREHSGKSLRELLIAGDIAASFGGNAGMGRAGAPRAGWANATTGPHDADGIYPLFPEATATARERYSRTGIYPLHSVIVLRSELAEKDPDLPTKLYDAFTRSKEQYLRNDPHWLQQPRLAAQRDIVKDDPIPYGVHANRESIAAMTLYSYRQGLIDSRPHISDLFAPGRYS